MIDWRIIFLILMLLVGLSAIGIILYVAFIVEITLSIGAFVFALIWIIWFKRSGWYLLSENTRHKIIQTFRFYRNE